MKPTRPRVFVTGGASGIGLAIARAFREAGHEVLVAGRNESRLRDSGLSYVILDVCDSGAVAHTLGKAGQIDIFVASAGGADTAPALKTPVELWTRMIELNLTSVFHCAQAALPQMVSRGWGRFIVIGSIASLRGQQYVSAYAAAKHGVLGFVRSLALELAKSGVTANAVCPGYTDTPMVDDAIAAVAEKSGRSREHIAKALTDTNPMGRFVSPDDVAGAVLWLASDAGASVNGQAIAIDGGATA